MSAARYTLGIDLGTTHCALSWVDTEASDGETVVQGVLQVPQLTGPGAVQASRCCRPSSTCRTKANWHPAT